MSFALRMLSMRPLMAATTVAGGALLETRIQKKQEHHQGSFTLFRANKTRCDAAAPMSHDAATEQHNGALVPMEKSTTKELSPLVKNRTWFQQEQITTKFSDNNDEEDSVLVTDLFMIGTMHCDNASSVATKELLHHVQPDVIFVELCAERTAFLKGDSSKSFPTEPLTKETSFGDIYRKLAKEYGGEFKAALDFVESKSTDANGPILVLGDRPITVSNQRMSDTSRKYLKDKSWTYQDLYGSEPPREILPTQGSEERALAQLYKAWENKESFNDFLADGFLGNPDITAIWCQLPSDVQFPEETDCHVMVQERDVYMVCRLLQACRVLKPKSIVAVVGAAHMKGMLHLIRAGNIGTTIEAEDILSDLLATEHFPKDDHRIDGASWKLSTFRKAAIEAPRDESTGAMVVSDQ